MPYLCLIIFGLVISILVFKYFNPSKRWIKWIVTVAVGILPFSAFFAFKPIYENDLRARGTQVHVQTTESEVLGEGLMLIAIPGCPYCAEAVEYLKFVKHKADFPISVFVVGTTDVNASKRYEDILDGQEIEVYVASGKQLRRDLSLSRYPTFALVKDSAVVEVWSNSDFGVFALDKIKNELVD